MDLRAKLKQVRAGATESGASQKKSGVNLNPIKYIKESVTELRKVKWPTRQEVVRGTIGVLLISVLFVIILGGSDILFQKGLSRLLGEGVNTQSNTGAAGGGTSQVPIDPKTGQPIDLNGIDIKTDPAGGAAAADKKPAESPATPAKNQ